MGLRTDIWRTAIVAAALPDIIARGTLEGLPLHWLGEEGPHRFLADPFGLWRDGRLHVFAESYDHRERHGRIECLTLDGDYGVVDRRVVLDEPWHLSYPFLIEAEGEVWMWPEAFRSGGATFYRAVDFPHRWEPAARIALDLVPIDATPVFHDGLWWLFHAATGSARDKVSVLHLAYAERLAGPWRRHPASPVRRDPESARPGGTPVVVDGRIALPMQDCRRTYGGAIRMLFVDTLMPDRFAASLGPRFEAPDAAAPFTQGLHTLSAAGPVTLIDCKRLDGSPRALLGAARGYLPRVFSGPGRSDRKRTARGDS